ncbi:hypothetical protein JX266_003814 [Neoarthrinium moseri]|nr:hypothetical protein JX266_003814 [Neoarthrinium moseri]
MMNEMKATHDAMAIDAATTDRLVPTVSKFLRLFAVRDVPMGALMLMPGTNSSHDTTNHVAAAADPSSVPDPASSDQDDKTCELQSQPTNTINENEKQMVDTAEPVEGNTKLHQDMISENNALIDENCELEEEVLRLRETVGKLQKTLAETHTFKMAYAAVIQATPEIEGRRGVMEAHGSAQNTNEVIGLLLPDPKVPVFRDGLNPFDDKANDICIGLLGSFSHGGAGRVAPSVAQQGDGGVPEQSARDSLYDAARRDAGRRFLWVLLNSARLEAMKRFFYAKQARG